MKNVFVQKFKDLDAWRLAHRVVLDVYYLTNKFPKAEIFGLVSQMRRSAVSVTSNIAEGFGRKSYKEKVNFYYISKGSLIELKNQLIVSRDLNYISSVKYLESDEYISSAIKLLAGLIRSTNKHLNP